jgi:6-phosphogluconolactonase
MVNEAMFSKAPIPPQNVFRVHTEGKDAPTAALEYDRTLQTFFDLKPGEFPRFDLIFLGMGPDGHTASLFPDTQALAETQRLVVANWVEKFKSYRITFTFPVMDHAACVTFLASGPDKAPMIRQVLEENRGDLPSANIHPTNGRLIWLLDTAAAAGLSAKPS